MPHDQRPIGVFDSGVGGLTVLRALQAALPDEPTVYLGDTARVPYGTRSAATVVRYALNNARTLVKRADIKLLVVACNTVSAVALDALRQDLPIPVVGVIEPGARAALAAVGRVDAGIGVLGTAGTVRSGAYPRALAQRGHTGVATAVAAPLFVPLAEEGWTDGDVPRLVAARYLQALPADVEAVVLGCTHYPLLAPVIALALAESHPRARVVDGAAATAVDVTRVLDEQGLRAPSDTHPTHRLFVTDSPEQMARLSRAFLGREVSAAQIELIDVEMTA
ncbi:MAG: glutamate racemase [Deltaproteobacteria bacterium]|nr:glutamate racemase [Deltaproteobacteria bacterium]